MAWLRPEHGRRRMLSELLLCWTLCLAGLVASRVNIAIIYPVSTIHNTPLTEICHESVLAIYNSTQLLMIQMQMKMAFLRSTIIATCCYVSVDNSSICHEFMMFWRGHTATPPAASLQSHCCEGKMSQNHNNTFAETAVKNAQQQSRINI